MSHRLVSSLRASLLTVLLAGIFLQPQPMQVANKIEDSDKAVLTTPVKDSRSSSTSNSTALTDEQRQAIESVVRASTSQIWFEKNVGQFPAAARYGFRTAFGSMLVYDDHLQMLVNQVDPTTQQVGIHTVNMSFSEANATWQIIPGGLSNVTGTYQNSDGTASHPNIYKELTLRNVYDGIDLRLYSAEQGTLEFDWLVARAQDYQKIQTAFFGQDGISYGADGALTLSLRHQNLTLKMPETYQVIDGIKHNLTAQMVAGTTPNTMRYVLGGNVVADQPLVIDPSIAWSTYIDLNDNGAAQFDSYVYSIAVNSNGVYASGWMRETVTNAAFGGPTRYMEVNAGFSIGTAANQNYIYRLNSTGTNVTAWTSTGRANNDSAVANQKIDSATNDAVADLELFPDGRVLTGFASGIIQIYAADLSTRSYSAEPVTMDTLNAVAIVSNGSFYASGRVAAAIPIAQIPAANIGPDATFAGTQEGVIIRYSNATTVPTPDWATYVGGTLAEYFTAIDLTPDKANLVFVTSTQVGATYPGLVNAVDNTIAGVTELLVGVLPDGAAKPAAFSVFSYLGGATEEGTIGTNTTVGVVTATNTFFFVASNTNSTAASMPGIAGGGQAVNGGGLFDTFISRIPINGSAGAGFQTTFLGGTTEDNIGGIAFDTAANQLLVFGTTRGGFPTVDTVPASNYYQGAAGGGLDIFVAIFNATLTAKSYATYIGGGNNDYLGQTGDLIGQGHVVYSVATGLSYLATTVHSVLPAIAIGTPGGKDITGNTNGNDAHTVFAFNLNSYDYGDAPLTYDNGAAANAANSAISTTIRIGATVDAEAAPASGVLATGDDLANTGSADDEDGIATLNTLSVGDTTYSATVSVLNTSGATRVLQGWIDFNKNGTFETGEFTSANVLNAATTATLTWSGLPVLTVGQSYLRLRLNDGALTDSGATAYDDRSIGRAGSGEVEDYALTIVSVADLAVTKSDSKTTYTPGGAISYAVVVSNSGPGSAIGATVVDAIPAFITTPTWTCVASAGASCTASGAGNINDTVTIPSGGNVTYTIIGTVSGAASGTLTNTATATVPAGTTDPVPGNNSGSDSDISSVCASGQFTRWDFENVITPSIGSGTFTAVNVTGPGYVAGVTGQAVSYSNWPLVVATTNYYDFAVSTVGRGAITMTFNESRSATGPVTFVAYYSPDGITYTALGVGIATTATPAWGAQTINFGAITALNDNPNAHFRLYAYSATAAAGTWRLDNVSFTGNCLADLAVTKTDGTATYTAGGTTTYTVVASNAGPSNVTGATLTDTFPAAITTANWTCVGAGGATCPAASGSGNINAAVTIPAGGSLTYTITATISAGAAGNLVNTATITAPAGVTDPVAGNNTATDTDTPNPITDVAITKTDGSATYTAGNAISYTIVVSNTGPSNATGASVADTVPAAITGTTIACVASGTAVCGTNASAGNALSFTGVNIPVGGANFITITVSGTVASATAGNLVNTATVTAGAGQTDPTPANNTATDTDTPNPITDVAITKTDGSATYTAGNAISYTIVVSNTGPSNATGASVADTIPAAITGTTITCVASGTAVCGTNASAGNALSFTGVNIPVGGANFITITVSGTVASATTGNLVNTATVTAGAGQTDPTPANNTATDTDTPNPITDVAITKTDGSATYTAGNAISYTIVVSNTGPSNATGASVADTIPAAITGTTITCVASGTAVCGVNASAGNALSFTGVNIPVGGANFITITVSGTVASATVGNLVNTATVTAGAGQTDPTPANNTATDTDGFIPVATITVTPASVLEDGA
ncbi:MAG: GEVED domain-containing protein, partial [Chloroflexota bacterium]